MSVDIPDLPAPIVAPIRTGGSGGRFSAPTDDDFDALAPIDLTVPSSLFDDAQRVGLTLDWVGDAVRVFIGDAFVSDQFWYGRPLEVDLTPYREALAAEPLRLRAFAWNPASGVYVDARVRPEATDPLLEIRSATVSGVVTRVLS